MANQAIKPEQVLVVVAHPDDESLGAGGTLLKHREAGDKITILILANGEDSRGADVADADKRWAQTKAVADAYGAHLFTENLPDQKFDTVPILEINKMIEKVIRQIKPTLVYTHHLQDLNLDHRLTAQAALTACRPQPGFPVKKILTFETLSSTEWQAKRPANAFCPTEYVDIADYVEKKISTLQLYQDELRDFPHPRSAEGIRALARYRGMEVGYEAAEAFEVIRNLRD
jgi:LmbE family N-acetylglucosaminyl deacetylase